MTLDEAIKHAEQMVEIGETYEVSKGVEEYRQLAEWLRELKKYRERIPSYEAGYNDAKREIVLSGEYERTYERGKADAQPKIGHWVRHPKGIYAHLVCNKCLSSAPYDCRTNFCPNCGAKMEDVEK